MKDKGLSVPATLEIARYAAPWKITKHISHLQSSVFFLNQTKITHSTGNGFSMVNLSVNIIK